MRINSVLLADNAQVVGNRLALSGGLWDEIVAPSWPATHLVRVVLLLSPDEKDLGRELPTTVRVVAENDVEVGATNGFVTVGALAEQVAAVFAVTVVLQAPGRHVVLARMGSEERRVSFQALGPAPVPLLLRGAGPA